MYYELTTLLDIVVDAELPLFCDTETEGFYGKIRLFQCYQKGWDAVLMVERPNALHLAGFLASKHSVWHNSHYDITTIQQQTGSRFVPTRFNDTFLASRLAQPEFDTYSLDAVMTRVLGYDPYDEFDKKALQKSDWSKFELTDEQLCYAATDVQHMPEVWDAVKHVITDTSYQLDMLTVRHCLDFQWNGMAVDNTKLEAKYIETEKALAAIHMPINANSWQQVRHYLGGIEESDKRALSLLWLRDGEEKARDVLEVRKLRKLMNFLTKYDSERVFGKFKPSTRSGRLSSDDHNMQQIPSALKGIFGYPPEVPRVLIYSDYAQLELRTICAKLKVRLMERLFREDVDVHGYCAGLLFSPDYTKQERTIAKTYNFNLLYSGGANMVVSILLGFGVLMDVATASRHKNKWLNIFPEINKWQQEGIKKWRAGRLNSTPLGRKYKAKLTTDYMNITNQGAGAEVAKLALHYFKPWLDENYPDVQIVNFIHDSFILDCPDDQRVYEVVSKKLAECMQEGWFELSKSLLVQDLPMPVNVRVGKNWGDLENDIFQWEYDLEGMAMYEGEE